MYQICWHAHTFRNEALATDYDVGYCQRREVRIENTKAVFGNVTHEDQKCSKCIP